MAEPDPGTPPPTDQPAPEPELSLAEHEAQFGTEGRGPQPEPEPGPDEPEPEPDGRRVERDASGKFVKPERHRAKSQQAGAGDVPRIQELTRKLRETEAERDALRTAPRPTLSPPPAPAPAVADRDVARPAAPAGKPKIDDFQEYGDYVEALADWKIAEARRQDRETTQRETEARQVADSWRTKVDAAKTKYADFEQVALLAPTAIPQGSLIDAWILEHRSGADVLYTLQQNPQELSRILALPIFDQVEALTLLGQRTGPTREADVNTGASPTTRQKVAPRPPTPVRTSAVSTGDEPPDPETASLAQHEKYYYRTRR
jgi:hypothetical protein